MKAEFNTIDGTCGVGVMSQFINTNYYDSDYKKDILRGTPGGCGWLVVGFITNNRKCRQAYVALTKKYTIVYKSPTRKNVNSGNNFYFVVFDTLGTDAKIGYDEFDNDDEFEDDEEY